MTQFNKNVELNHCIDKMVEIKRKYALTPEKSRYVDRRVREILNLKVPFRSKTLPDFLNPAEIYHLFEKAYAHNTQTGLLVEFLVFTGLRINEARCLTIDNLDFSNNQLKVVSGKGAKDRYVPISNDLLSKIKLHLNDRKRGYVFCKGNEVQFTKRALQKRIENVIDECKFTKQASTHTLRHSAACLWLSRGMTLPEIQLMMGHNTVKTTEIYAKLELGDVKQKYLALVGNQNPK